jgi:hypothetical protein
MLRFKVPNSGFEKATIYETINRVIYCDCITSSFLAEILVIFQMIIISRTARPYRLAVVLASSLPGCVSVSTLVKVGIKTKVVFMIARFDTAWH